MAALELINTSLFSDANLQAYYRLEGNFNDSKNSNNLTASGSPATVVAQFGNGKSFVSASSQYANGTLTAPTGSFTIIAWVKFSSLTTLDAVAAFGDAGGSNYTGLCIGAGNNTIRFVKNGGAGQILDSTVTISTGTVYMVSCVYNGSQSKVGVNATIKSTADTTNPSTTGTFGLGSLGAYTGSALGNMNFLDDVAYFNRALSDAEIIAHYNGTDGTGGAQSDTSYAFIM